jgi:Protein of unknown function (DUF2490)
MTQKIQLLAMVIWLFSSSIMDAQSPVRMTSTQQHLWGTITGNIQLDTSKYYIFYDVQIRRNELGLSAQQELFRLGLIKQATKSTSFGLGYAFANTVPYGDFPVKNPFYEHRIWEQLQHRQYFSRSNLTHRYRLEQRRIGNSEYGKFEKPRLENRVRYMVRYQYTLRKHDTHPLFANLFDEVFVNFGQEVTRNIFDQNRIGGSLGIGLFKGATLELGYLNQYIMLRGLTSDGKNKMENNHTYSVSLIWNTRIKKRRGP